MHATKEGQLFSLYTYDPDTGEVAGILKDLTEDLYPVKAMEAFCGEGYPVKVVDQFDGCLVYTLGV